MTPTTRRFLAVLAVLGVLGAGCGDDDTDDADGGISVADAWARATAPDAPTAAFYATIRNDTDDTDTLTGATTDVCDVVELHTMTMVDDVMSMMPADATELTVDAGETLVLEPGGLHVMCMGLREQLVVDQLVVGVVGLGIGRVRRGVEAAQHGAGPVEQQVSQRRAQAGQQLALPLERLEVEGPSVVRLQDHRHNLPVASVNDGAPQPVRSRHGRIPR